MPINLALLKNGLGFFTYETVVPGPGEYEVIDLPVPAHGTFWVNYPSEKLKLETVKGRVDKVKEAVEPVNIYEILQASVGHTVNLHVTSAEKVEKIEGKI